MSLKHEFVTLALREGANIRELCRRYGVSPPTAYQLLDRYAREGEAGLAKRSRRPHHSPNRTPGELELAVLEVREEHPTWGGRTLRKVLHNSGYGYVPSPSAITAILRRNDRLATGERAPHHWQRFEHAQPNDLWQMDFKGHFPTGAGRCRPLTVLDDHSRFALGVQACADERTETVRECLSAVFRVSGLPEWMLMDNGSPWGNDAEHPRTPLTVWLMRLGIRVSHGRPYHPQTQGKGGALPPDTEGGGAAGQAFRRPPVVSGGVRPVARRVQQGAPASGAGPGDADQSLCAEPAELP